MVIVPVRSTSAVQSAGTSPEGGGNAAPIAVVAVVVGLTIVAVGESAGLPATFGPGTATSEVRLNVARIPSRIGRC
jgi:hypothetical protein